MKERGKEGGNGMGKWCDCSVWMEMEMEMEGYTRIAAENLGEGQRAEGYAGILGSWCWVWF